jgi:hypothetical protein
MKLYISENIHKGIQGFTIIPIIYGELDLSKVPDNAASTIIAIDAIDSIKHENLPVFIQSVAKKMRLDSTISLGGSDIYAISRGLLGGSITEQEYNQQFIGKNSISSSKYILELLKNTDLKINSVVFRGNTYEISATRPAYKN